ncbi:replication-associated recombination protein A [candidate division WWE3 bacterium]|uniref:Replication-associated recombination protein A n=1 Tax=candidate division WWE3 bacterium TaxID=2053526 RepID=A0A955LHP0_UNCKA|nr:replication-associated recombination protein A [candidate division WWE3 bacterium]
MVSTADVPLADRMRPRNLSEFVGQEHLVGEGKIIRKFIEDDKIPSMIFWGPPGTGKTTLAKIISQTTESELISLSATMHGVKELREVFEKAKINKNGLMQKKTIVFIDEIHRFNKAQQDALLPHIENGTIVMIGATTENPSFEVNSAVLSRVRVFTLNQLTHEHISQVILSALSDRDRGLGGLMIDLDDDALQFLAEFANGDARTALNVLELSVLLKSEETNNAIKISIEDIKEAMQKTYLQYDRQGDEHYNTISAFIKSMRASDPDAALYYLARMVSSGEDPLFIARRMVIFASEDIGRAQPTALVIANAVFRSCETIGYPECQINLAHGVVYLATCKKDRSAYEAYFKALEDAEKFGNLPIPLHLRNAPTSLMKELGYGEGYEKYPDKSKNLLPEKLNGKKYLRSSE